jgi:hypothetical protein
MREKSSITVLPRLVVCCQFFELYSLNWVIFDIGNIWWYIIWVNCDEEKANPKWIDDE